MTRMLGDFFATNLTTQKLQKEIDPVIGRKREIDRLIHILSRRTKNNPVLVGDQDLTARILSVDLGDRIDITDLPAWLPPDPVRAIVQGYEMAITPDSWRITWNATPYAPYATGVYAGSSVLVAGDPTMLVSDDFTGADRLVRLKTARR